MKRAIQYLVPLAIAIVLWACKETSSFVPGDAQGTTKHGNVHLSFVHAPAGIVQVIAYLTPGNFPPGSLPPVRVLPLSITDSTQSASGSIDDLAIGMWHLRVDALDDTGHVRYTGQTDVEILPDQTTSVTLQLHATGGSLDIQVTWGSGSCAPVPDGLVSWWKGEENGLDVMGLNNGTLHDISFAQGMVGAAFQFNGQSYIDIGNPASLKLTTGITIDAWVKPSVAPPRDDAAISQMYDIVAKIDQTNINSAYELGLHNPDGNVRLLGGIGVFGVDDHGLRSGGIVPVGQWSHVAMTYDGATGMNKLYVNGELVAQRVWPGGITTSDVEVCIGKEASIYPRYFHGAIDEVDIFDRALSQAEIQAIYTVDAAGKCP